MIYFSAFIFVWVSSVFLSVLSETGYDCLKKNRAGQEVQSRAMGNPSLPFNVVIDVALFPLYCRKGK